MIETSKYIDLNLDTKKILNKIIQDEFGYIPIVQETEWATPDWTIIYYEGNGIARFYNIVERQILVDDKKMKVAGINNVITPQKNRGQGYSSKTLKGVASLVFEELNCEAGLLLCADALITFYARLGWYEDDCPLYFHQASGEKLWTAKTMMLTKDGKLNPKISI
jgi:hypothetical protein